MTPHAVARTILWFIPVKTSLYTRSRHRRVPTSLGATPPSFSGAGLVSPHAKPRTQRDHHSSVRRQHRLRPIARTHHGPRRLRAGPRRRRRHDASIHGSRRRTICRSRYCHAPLQFPYMEHGSRRPDPPAIAHATVRAAVDEAANDCRVCRCFAGGKSFGGRMTSQAQAEAPLPASGNSYSSVSRCIPRNGRRWIARGTLRTSWCRCCSCKARVKACGSRPDHPRRRGSRQPGDPATVPDADIPSMSQRAPAARTRRCSLSFATPSRHGWLRISAHTPFC